jgi:hypothetical protein
MTQPVQVVVKTNPQCEGDVKNSMSEEELIQNLKAKLFNHFRELGFLVSDNGELKIKKKLTKEEIRRLHASRRRELLKKNKKFLEKYSKDLLEYIASGEEVVPDEISPKIVPIKDPNTLESRLFRFATLNWSIPVSYGFGRRLRCLVMDESNNKLIGIFGLGDPVFNLRVRDEWIGWSAADRRERLRHVLDAFVVGAVPPYSFLKGSKLIAAMIPSKEVLKIFRKKYRRKESIIRKRAHSGDIVLITTSSALGRSSLYSRVRVNSRLLYERIGMNSGYGHFHLSDEIFNLMRELLLLRDHKYYDGYKFGEGPNWRIRVIKVALRYLGLSPEVLRHGVRREVYGAPLAENFREFLRGEQKRAKYSLMPLSEIVDYTIENWIVKRAKWDKRYKSYKAENYLKEIEEAGGFSVGSLNNKPEDNEGRDRESASL